MNGEQKGAARGSRPQGKHMGEEVTRGHCPSAHTAQVGRLKPREQERLTRVLVASSYCLPSGLLRTLSNLPNWGLHCVLRPQGCIVPKEDSPRSYLGLRLNDLYLYS